MYGVMENKQHASLFSEIILISFQLLNSLVTVTIDLIIYVIFRARMSISSMNQVMVSEYLLVGRSHTCFHIQYLKLSQPSFQDLYPDTMCAYVLNIFRSKIALSVRYNI
jgi:hypothetical protein